MTPWKVPMPRLTVLQTVANNDPHNLEFGVPDGTTPVDGATRRVAHQYFSHNANSDTFGAGSQGSFIPQKFYEMDMKEDFIQLHPDLPAKPGSSASTTTRAMPVSPGR